jgi:hypothetical protein
MSPLLAVNAASPATPDLPNTPPKSFADTADAHSNRNCPRLHVCLPKKTQLVQQKEEKAKKKIDLNDTFFISSCHRFDTQGFVQTFYFMGHSVYYFLITRSFYPAGATKRGKRKFTSTILFISSCHRFDRQGFAQKFYFMGHSVFCFLITKSFSKSSDNFYHCNTVQERQIMSCHVIVCIQVKSFFYYHFYGFFMCMYTAKMPPKKTQIGKQSGSIFFMSLGWSNWGVVSLYLMKDPAVALTMATAHNCEVSVSPVPILLISFNTKKMNQLNA